MASASPDFALPYVLHDGAFRGRLVRVSQTIDGILARHAYPPAVSRLVAETAALAAVLADSLKYDGVFTLQARGDGPVRQLVADVTSDGELRAYAGFDEEAAASIAPASGDEEVSVQRLLGTGHLAFTVDQGKDMHRYQGIVELEGRTLSDCIHAYFRRSEQLETAIKVASRPPKADGDGWHAGALMMQRMPVSGGSDDVRRFSPEELDDLWRTNVVLLGSLTVDELLAPALPGEQLLFRLFHQEGLRVAPLKPLHFGCRCSRERVEGVLSTFSEEELAAMRLEDGSVSASCQFCSQEYIFTEQDLAAVRARAAEDQ